MKRGEVWWVDFEPAIGSEIKKIRPAVIVSNDSANHFLSRVVVVPMTSNVEKVYPAEAIVLVNGCKSKIMADQIMTADKRRLQRKVANLEKKEMVLVEDAIKVHLALPK